MIRSFLARELKCIDRKRTVLLIAVLTFMATVIYVGQLGRIEQELGLDIDGIVALIRELSSTLAYRNELSQVLFGVGVVLPLLVYFAYAGLPYLLSVYSRGVSDGSLIYLMIMPVDIRSVVIASALFAFARTIVMTASTYGVLAALTLLCGGSASFRAIDMLHFAVMSLDVLCLYMASASVIWLFNGSTAVIAVIRFAIIGCVLVVVPASTVLVFRLPNLGIISFAVLAVSVALSVICLKLIDRFYDKEKTILSARL